MKRLKYIKYIFLFILLGCQEAGEYLFSDVSRIQMDNSTLVFSFVYLPATIVRDTIEVPVEIIGGPADKSRKVRLTQITEYDVSYVKDNNGYIIDTVVTEVTNKAIPGVHYVAFDDVEMGDLLSVASGKVKTNLPVILLRDPSLKTQEVRLGIKLEVSEDFQLGERDYLTRTIIISDQLAKPSKWYFWYDICLGEYSVTRHQFMIDVLKMPIDDEWLSKNMGDILYMRDKCAKALYEFNHDPANIASGKAPLREDPDNPNSKVLTFPTIR